MTDAIATDSSNAAERWVVNPEWLYQWLAPPEAVSQSQISQSQTEPQLVVIDCRFSLADPNLGRQQYEAAHIPGAYYLDLNSDLSSPVQQHGGRHPLPDPVKLAEALTAMGVHSGENPTLVVAYDDSRLAFAARLWWLLRYLGHEQVAVLNGGFSGWQQAGYPVTADRPPAQAGRFSYQIRPELSAEIEAVRRLKPSSALIDSREPERYRGEREPIDPIAGHIPGAVNYPWQEVTDAGGFVYPIAQQQQRWADLPASEEVIVYCGSGVTACVNLLSLELAGIKNAKLYPGSWSDWCSYLTPDGTPDSTLDSTASFDQSS